MENNNDKMDASVADSNYFSAGTSKDKNEAPADTKRNTKRTTFDPSSEYYDMAGDKLLFIVNHIKFKKTNNFSDTPSTRDGAHEDVNAIRATFIKLGFRIITFTDFTYDDIMSSFKNIASHDHSKTSCLIVVIMTHGDKGGVIYAADRPYFLNDIFRIIESGDIGRVNKPKLFFVQACRGTKADEGRTVEFDGGDGKSMLVPSHIDFLIMRSSVEDHISWRGSYGSWMIQELCEVIKNHSDSMDLLQMITRTNRNVAYRRASNVPNDSSQHNRKQTIETRFTLTKLLKF